MLIHREKNANTSSEKKLIHRQKNVNTSSEKC